MGSGEKKIVVVLTVVLIGLIVAYVAFQPKPVAVGNPMAKMGGEQTATAGAGDPTCSTGGGGGAGGVATQEFGKKGAKLEIVAALPITHGCHTTTEAELKNAYGQYKSDIHLTIYDLFGSEGQAFVGKNGGQRAVIFINGKTSFQLNGKTVTLERQEGMSYQPSDLGPIVAQALKQS